MTTKIDKKSISMAQNIINLQYTHVPNAGNAIVPAGYVNQLPSNSLVGNADAKRPDHRKLSEHKMSIGFTLTVQGKDLCRQWRKAVKDQLLARNFTTLSTLPDHDFQQIVGGMRRLRPICDSLVNASAANDVLRMQEIDEAVVQMVKDCGRKLRDSLALYPPAPHQPGVPAVVQGHLIVPLTLRPQGAPAHWDPATPGPVVPAPPGPVVPGPDEPAAEEPAVLDPDEPATEEPTVLDPDEPAGKEPAVLDPDESAAEEPAVL